MSEIDDFLSWVNDTINKLNEEEATPIADQTPHLAWDDAEARFLWVPMPSAQNDDPDMPIDEEVEHGLTEEHSSSRPDPDELLYGTDEFGESTGGIDNYRVPPETLRDIYDPENTDLGTGLPVWEDVADHRRVNTPNIQNSALGKLMKAVEDDEDGTRGAYRGKGKKHSGRGKDWKRRDRMNRPDPEDTSGFDMSVNELAASPDRRHKRKAYNILSRNAHKFKAGSKKLKLFEQLHTELYPTKDSPEAIARSKARAEKAKSEEERGKVTPFVGRKGRGSRGVGKLTSKRMKERDIAMLTRYMTDKLTAEKLSRMSPEEQREFLSNLNMDDVLTADTTVNTDNPLLFNDPDIARHLGIRPVADIAQEGGSMMSFDPEGEYVDYPAPVTRRMKGNITHFPGRSGETDPISGVERPWQNIQNDSALDKLMKAVAPENEERYKVTPFKGSQRTKKEFPRGPSDPKFYESTKGQRSRQNINAAIRQAMSERDTATIRQYLIDKPDEEGRRNFKAEMGEAIADKLGESPEDVMDMLGDVSEEDFRGMIEDILGESIGEHQPPPETTHDVMEPPLGMSQEGFNQGMVDNITRMGGSQAEAPHVPLDTEGEYVDYPAPMTTRMPGAWDKGGIRQHYKGRPGVVDPISGVERPWQNIQNSSLDKLMKAVSDTPDDDEKHLAILRRLLTHNQEEEADPDDGKMSGKEMYERAKEAWEEGADLPFPFTHKKTTKESYSPRQATRHAMHGGPGERFATTGREFGGNEGWMRGNEKQIVNPWAPSHSDQARVQALQDRFAPQRTGPASDEIKRKLSGLGLEYEKLVKGHYSLTKLMKATRGTNMNIFEILMKAKSGEKTPGAGDFRRKRKSSERKKKDPTTEIIPETWPDWYNPGDTTRVMQTRSEPETKPQVTPDTPKGEEPNREAVNPKKRKYQKRKSKVKVIKPADDAPKDDSALDKLLKAVAEEDENPEQRRLIRDLSEADWLSVGHRGPEADIPEEQQDAIFAGDVWTTHQPDEQGEVPPIVEEMMGELAQRMHRTPYVGGFRPDDWEGDILELFPNRSNPNWGTPLGPSEEDFKNYSELRNDSALDKLLKAVGDEDKRSEDWWWRMVSILDDQSLGHEEALQQLEAAGVTDDEIEEVFDRSVEDFDDPSKRDRGGYGAERKRDETPTDPRIDALLDQGKSAFRAMGMSDQQIVNTIRDLKDKSKHKDLRDEFVRGQSLIIGDKPGDFRSNEQPNAQGKFPKTEATGEHVINSLRNTLLGGGQNLEGQGSVRDMQAGWSKVQPPTARQFREQPELRNATALDKLLKATEEDTNFLRGNFPKTALSKLLKQAPNQMDYPAAEREYWHSRGAGTRHPFTRFGFFPGAGEGDPALESPGGDPGLWSPEAGDLGSQPWDWEKPDISGATLPKYWEDVVDIAERQAEMDKLSGKEPVRTPEMNIAAMQTDGSSSILREQFNRKGNA